MTETRIGLRQTWPYLLLLLVGAILLIFGLRFLRTPSLEQFPARDLSEESIERAFGHLRSATIGLGVVIMLAAPAFFVWRDRLSELAQRSLYPPGDFYADKGVPRKALDLFLISFLGLFFEMLIIRWLSAEFRLFAYFKNLPLLAAFMGLGIGFGLVRRRVSLFPLALALITLLCGLIVFGTRTTILDLVRYPAQEEFVWSLSIRSSWLTIAIFCGVIAVFFFVTVATFIPFGQLTGRLMNRFEPLTGYTINIAGSLVGIWAFAGVSFLSLPPFYWFLVALLLCLWFLQGQTRLLIGGAILAAVCLGMLLLGRGDSRWSPYYKIDLEEVILRDPLTDGGQVQWGHELIVNQDYHQKALDLSPEFVGEYGHLSPDVEIAQRAYDLPYDFITPEEVLVVGAGAGNDVASALRHGAARIDAVEIDPVIANLGDGLHPEQPYRAPQVEVVVDDARSFFEKSDRQYDLIVFGFLDSHTLFSSMSSVRLDNFVYTVECLQEAKEHLKEDGILALTFSLAKKWIGSRLAAMLGEVFEQEPLAMEVGYDGGVTFLVGPGLEGNDLTEEHRLRQLAAEKRLDYEGHTPPATDDWPYLYLKERTVPDVYWQVLLLLLILSVTVVFLIFPESVKVDLHFFFLGCAFFLIETKSITETALLFGSTWIVNSVVVSAILIMILGANLFVRRFTPDDVRPYYVLLLGSLILNYLVPVSSILGQNFVLRGVVSGLAISLPLFFAGIIFATSLRRLQSVEMAFGSNLLGSVVGGVLEYGSLMFGIKALYLFAGLAYVLSWLGLRPRK